MKEDRHIYWRDYMIAMGYSPEQVQDMEKFLHEWEDELRGE